jgi:hypothetical protein
MLSFWINFVGRVPFYFHHSPNIFDSYTNNNLKPERLFGQNPQLTKYIGNLQ